MKMRWTIIWVFGFASAFGVPNLRADQQCSNASLHGTYGFHGFATIVAPLSTVPGGTPRSIIGVFTLDGRGNWTAKLTQDDNGNIVQLQPSGTYVVYPDCTGLFSPAVGGSLAIVVVDGGNEFYQMRLDPASIVVFGTTKRIFPGDSAHQ